MLNWLTQSGHPRGYEYAQTVEGYAYLAKKVEEKMAPLLFWSIENYAQISAFSYAVTHGDLVQGNMLISSESRLGLLDFDNIAMSYLPHTVDLGMAAHRAGVEMLGMKAAPPIEHFPSRLAVS